MVRVETRSIGKSYGGARVLDDVSVIFRPGLLTSLLGPSGSGKTTLLRVIGGFVAPDAGEVRFDDENVTAVPVWKRNIGMVFQSYALFPHMSVEQNVAFGVNRRGVRGAAARNETARALELVRLGGLEGRKPKELSGGQQQRVALARAIVTNPRVLLLDEPLSALDRRLRQDMQIELRRIQRESGLTTIFVTHDQEEALTLSDSVAILDRGRIVQQGAPSEIYERPRTRFAASFLGDANFFSGVATEGGVNTALGLLRVADPLPPAGAPATIAVRPEKLEIVSVANASATPYGDNSIQAEVVETVYAGAVSTILLRTADGASIKALTQNREALAPRFGEKVVVSWSAAQSVVIEG